MSATPEKKASTRRRKPQPKAKPAPQPEKLSTSIADDNDCYESLGIHAGDKLEGEEAAISDLRAGDLIAVFDNEDNQWAGIGRFESADEKQFHIYERDARTYNYTRGEGYWTIYLLTAITRRIPIERGTTEELERAKRDGELAALRTRLDKLSGRVILRSQRPLSFVSKSQCDARVCVEGSKHRLTLTPSLVGHRVCAVTSIYRLAFRACTRRPPSQPSHFRVLWCGRSLSLPLRRRSDVPAK
jgi:hypothetical protein